MRVLVTGGAGFLGSHIIDELVAEGHDVVAIDSLDPGAHSGRPVDLSPDGDWRFHDLANFDATLEATRGVNAVIHNAAKVGTAVNFSDARSYVAQNDLATAVLLAALHESGFSGRFILASSVSVYGEGQYDCSQHGRVRPGQRHATDLDAGRFDPTCPLCAGPVIPTTITEDALLDPRNVYAATKAHQEQLCRIFSREHDGVTATMLRYHNVYGPRMPRDTPYAGVTSIFRSQIESGLRPRVFEDGGQRRDFVHVNDAVRANVLALTCDEPYDGPLNIATGRPSTLLEMATMLCAAQNTPLWPDIVGTHRVSDVRHVTGSANLAAAKLGFRADITLHDGMREFAQAELRNRPLDIPVASGA